MMSVLTSTSLQTSNERCGGSTQVAMQQVVAKSPRSQPPVKRMTHRWNFSRR